MLGLISPFTVHGAAARQRLDRVRAAVNVPSKPIPILLEIEGGLQAGARVTRDSTELTVGSDFVRGVVILDEGVPALAATITISRTIAGHVATILAGPLDIEVEGKALSAADGPRTCVLPCRINLTPEVSLFLSRPRLARDESVMDRVVRFLVGGVAATTALFFGLVALDTAMQADIHLVMISDTEVPAETDTELRNARVAELSASIERSGLAPYLSLDSSSEGVVRVVGSVPESGYQGWTEINLWFDGLEGAPPLFSQVRRTPDLNKLPPISAILLSEPQTIFLATGEQLVEGDILIDRWVVGDIAVDGLALRRGVETTFVPF